MEIDETELQLDICRVCRCEGTSDKPLYHPCVCTGSIKFIHQDCLVQWLKYSRKEFCELCKHRFAFTPIYSPDMPKRLPIKDIVSGLLASVGKAVRYWFHYTLVTFAWLGVVPLTACRIYRCLFTGSVSSLLTLPLDMLSTENIASDCFHGCFVVTCTLCAFISLVWLREQILHGGGPDWLEQDVQGGPPRNLLDVGVVNNLVGLGGGGGAREQGANQNEVNNEAPPGEPEGEIEEGEAVNGNNAPEQHAVVYGGDVQEGLEAGVAREQVGLGEPANEQGGIGGLGGVGEQGGVANFGAGGVRGGVGGVGGGGARDEGGHQNQVHNEGPHGDHEEELEEEGADNGNNAAQDDNNWNPIEWDRAAEELTWERLLGLDGSLVFLEHVFWVVSLNTLFILVFAFCPYHIGHFTMIGMKMGDLVSSSHFEGLLTTLIGYVVIAFSLVILYAMCAIVRLRKFRRVLGLCYVVVKVKLLVVVEIGVFPLICGWWLDVCSLSMFDATLKDRKMSFHLAPGTSMFIHWLVGMVYVFYFASFILLLREVLRPGVLWFLRNLNDPEFNPIQEMIHLPVYRHTRRFVASVIIFGSTVLLMLWLPVRMIRRVLPGFLPYNVMLSSDAPVSELSLELLLLQVVLPALLEQGHTRMWLKGLVRGWTLSVAYLLNLRSYLVGDVPLGEHDTVIHGDAPQPHPGAQPHPVGVQPAAAAALLQGGGPTVFQSYKRPRLFYIRIFLLVVLMCVTLFAASVVCLILPVFFGRKLMSLWMGEAKIHELYTAACGLYVCWLMLRIGTVLYNWIPQGTAVILNKLKEWLILALKTLFVAVILMGVVPLLLGLLFELVVVAPLRVSLDQTPVFFPWQDWALGVLHTKIICAITMMGPQWWLKRVIEQVYNDGLRNMNLKFILYKLCFPVIGVLGMSLSLPYVVARSFIPVLGFDFEIQNLVLRRIYPLLLACVVFVFICLFQARQFKRLYEHIKNDKYLVGQRLVNYDHKRKQRLAAEAAAAAAANKT